MLNKHDQTFNLVLMPVHIHSQIGITLDWLLKLQKGIRKLMIQYHHIRISSFCNSKKTTLQVKQREINSKRTTFLHNQPSEE